MVSFWEVFPRVPVVQPKTELRAHRSDGLTSGRPCGVPCGVPGYQCFPRRELPMAKTYHLKMYFLLDFRLENVDFHCQVSLLEVNLPLFIQKPASSTFPLPRSKTAKKMRRNTWFSFPMARHPKKGGNWNIPEIDRTTKGTGCVLMCFASILWIPWGQCRNCCFKVEFLI